MSVLFDWSKTIANLPVKPVPQAWIDTKGKGVKLAFIDTGANLGLGCLQHLNLPGRKFFVSSQGFSVSKLTGQDLIGEAFAVAGVGHGTLYTSLIAGKIPDPAPVDKDLVGGIAPGAEIYLIKATDLSGEITGIRHLLNALELSANLGIDIAITGQCISRSEMLVERLTDAEVDRVFSIPGVKRMMIFAPLKNRKSANGWSNITGDNFPSLRTEIFNVAALPDIFPDIADLIQGQNIHFLLAGFKGSLLTKKGLPIDLGDTDLPFSNSGATAIMGAIGVLALSAFKLQNGGAMPSRDQFANLLGSISRDLSDAFGSFDTPAIFKNF